MNVASSSVITFLQLQNIVIVMSFKVMRYALLRNFFFEERVEGFVVKDIKVYRKFMATSEILLS